MNRIERDIFKIITEQDYDALRNTESWMSEIERAQLLAKKFEEGIRDAFRAGSEWEFYCKFGDTKNEGIKPDFTDYLKSIKE